MKFFLSYSLLCLGIIFTTSGCKEREVLFPENSLNYKYNLPPDAENIKTLPIDVTKSRIVWRGTKLGGIRGHEGIVEFEQGHLLVIEDSLIGGYFIANMQSLEVTDIPDEQATAKNNLKNHLKSEFKTETYPLSFFEITNIQYSEPHKFQAVGKLKIMGIENNISAPLLLTETTSSENLITTNIMLNREDWGIGEEAGWLEKRVVDKHFHLEITIIY